MSQSGYETCTGRDTNLQDHKTSPKKKICSVTEICNSIKT